MPFPPDWNVAVGGGLRRPDNIRSLRVFLTGTATTNFADQATAFRDVAGANPYTPTPKTNPGNTSTVNFGQTPRGVSNSSAPYPGVSGSQPRSQLFARYIQIQNDDTTNNLEVTFDGVTVHDVLGPGEVHSFSDRYEPGLALRGVGGTADYRVWAW